MANVAPALERGLLPAQLRTLRLAANASAKHGVSPFLVGGTVRDLLLNKSPADIDLSAGGGSSEFATALAEELDGAIIARTIDALAENIGAIAAVPLSDSLKRASADDDRCDRAWCGFAVTGRFC